MRSTLKHHLDVKCPGHDWSSLAQQIGMFYLSKLTPEQGTLLRTKHHIYMLPSSGRINIGALSDETVEILAEALIDVIQH